MATPQNSGNTPARQQSAHNQDAALQTAQDEGLSFADVKQTAPSPLNAPDMALEAAAAEAGEHPERTTQLAASLGLGQGDAPRKQSVLGYVLRKDSGIPPPDASTEWFPKPPAGSFDAGIARVTGQEHVFEVYASSLCCTGERWQMSSDHSEENAAMLREEVRQSYGFARYVSMLMSAIELVSEDGVEGVESEVSRMATVAFLAGWYMCAEENDKKQLAEGR